MEGAAQDDRIDSIHPAIDRPTKRLKPDSTLTGEQTAIARVVIEIEEQQAPPLSSTLDYDKGIVFS